jgi:hypothetical protein
MMDNEGYQDLTGLDVAATVSREFWTAVTRGDGGSFSFQGLVDDQDTLNVSVRAYPTAKSPIAVNIGSLDETKFRVTWLMTIDQAEQLMDLLRTGINMAKLSGRMEGTA